MTLQLRRKRPITAQSTPHREISARARACIAALRLALLGSCSLAASASLAQQPGWQPTRVPDNSSARPLHAQSIASGSAQAAFNQPTATRQADPLAAQQPSGVVLRWRSASRGPVDSNSGNSVPAATASNQTAAFSSASESSGARSQVATASGWSSNPLRDGQVRVANYQEQGNTPNAFNNPFGDSQPAFPPANLPPANQAPPNLPSQLPAQPLAPELPQLPGDSFSPPPAFQADPLSDAETPPPPTDTEPMTPPTVDPFPKLQPETQEPSPFDKRPEPPQDAEMTPDATDDADDERSSLEIPKRNKNANTISCNELRGRPFTKRLSEINLDVSPEYGEGLRARKDGKQQRLDFASTAPVREWTDYTGTNVAFGRLIDLRNDMVVLDVNGKERLLPLRDLSDIDIAYIAEAWNLPTKCGIGFESYAGRNFIASAAEWKASGLCHKPLYFEDVQLERYGHEVGPVLQPLISSAHFFGNMLILPYKMGIHPPGECQYALGYYRPGDCAPYMLQPFPLSLRGAAVQAGVITGGAALIP